MGQIISLTFIKVDSAVYITYQPVSSYNGNVKWKETGAANDLAATGFSVQNLPVKKSSAQVRKRLSVMMPVMEVSSGVNSSGYTAGPKVAFALGCNVDFLLNRRASTAQKLELLTLVARLLGFNGARTDNIINLSLYNDEVLT